MKRRRQQLQVSTFPFLAVLLCAMGALILVLLTMDRKSKLAAMQKAQEHERQKVADHARLAADRAAAQQARVKAARADWEGKREALRRRLDEEERAAREEITQARARLREAARKLRAEEEHAQELKRRLQSEKVAVARQEQDLVAARRKAADLAKLRTAAEREKARLAAELAGLERALMEARAAKEKQAARYSVVPYFGRQGGDRRPVYVECGPAGVIFHPDKKSLGAGTTPEDVRAEVERRLAAQADVGGAAEGARPYLMLLVRPEGIARYYQMQALARELKVELGYELIDAEWSLDYSREKGPVRAGAVGPGLKKTPVRMAGPALGGSPGAARVTGGGSGHNVTSGAAAAGGSPGGTGGGSSPAMPSGTAAPGGKSGGVRALVSMSKPQPFGGELAPSTPSVGGGHTPSTRDSAGPKGPALPGATSGPAGPASPAQGSAQGDPKSPPALPGSSSGGKPTSSQGKAAAPEGGKPANGEQPGRAGDAAAGPSLGPSLGGDPPAKREVSLRPAAISGDVETVIHVECRRDGAVVYPSGRNLAIDTLNHSPAHNPLLRAVQQAVARRQALARPGGPAPRVQVRFLVHRDGVETYHLAYPALGPVAADKKAYWLKPEDEVSKIVAGH